VNPVSARSGWAQHCTGNCDDSFHHTREQWGASRTAVLLLLPADHLIQDRENFLFAVSAATALAEAGRSVIFGIRPTFPEIGFGYIEAGNSLEPVGYCVRRFIEKATIGKSYPYATTY
jgi:mannose-1-phosphate guanylyltransferase